MSKVDVRPSVACPRWLDVVVGERVFASFQDDIMACRFAEQLARVKGLELPSDAGAVRSHSTTGTFVIGANGAFRSRSA